MKTVSCVEVVLVWLILAAVAGGARPTVVLRGEVHDSRSGKPIPARVYVRSSDGRWLFARSAVAEGSAVEYRKQRGPASVEMHTTVSAHPFFEDRPDGRVRFAHTSPVYVDVPQQPLRPRREEDEYFTGRMKEEIERNRDVLRPEALQEYRRALAVYEELATKAE